MIALALILGVTAALVQAAVLPAFYTGLWAAPVPACALIAGWAATRRPEETWTIALAAALVLGAISVERAGWFLLAMLPTVGAAMVLATMAPRNRSLTARVGRALIAASGGALGYAGTFAIASTSADALLEEAPGLGAAALVTGLLAALIVVCAAPFRRRPVGLFA